MLTLHCIVQEEMIEEENELRRQKISLEEEVEELREELDAQTVENGKLKNQLESKDKELQQVCAYIVADVCWRCSPCCGIPGCIEPCISGR